MSVRYIEMDTELINELCRSIAEETLDEFAEIQYDEMLEEMYCTDPRWIGPDWDQNA